MKRLLLVFLILLSLAVQAQTKYKDIVPMIEGTSDDYAMDVLNTFLINNLDHPAANLKMAFYYLKKANETDPLIDFDKLQAYANKAEQKLIKSRLLVTEKEVKKHTDYYAWVAQKYQAAEADYALVTRFIADETALLHAFQNSLPKLYFNFTHAVNSYSSAAKNFMNISSSYPSLKELYLRFDDKLDTKFTSLKTDYDSTLYYFEMYKHMTDTFKIKGYDQSLTIKPVSVFRYDGLVTQINFLTNNINIWNYGAWVDSVKTFVGTNIKSLRASLITNEERQVKALKTLEKGGFSKDIQVVKVDKSLVFNLLRFDYKNPIVPLLKYKESKQKLLIEESNSTYFDTANIDITRKLVYYNKMIYQLKESDSIITMFKNRFEPKRMEKYGSFLASYYNGVDGASQYMTSEKNSLKKEWNIYGNLLKEGVASIKPIDSIGTMLRYRKVNYPLHVSETSTPDAPTTTHILEIPSGGYYLAGQYKPNKKTNNQQLYLIGLTPQKKFKWFKKYDIELDSAGADSNQQVVDITLTNEGVALLVHSSHLTNQTTATTLLHILADGTTKIARRLTSNIYPRAVLYNDVQNNFVVVFNGTNKDVDASAKNNLELVSINSLGESGWTYSESSIGAFAGLTRIKQGYLVSRNSTTVSSAKVLLTIISNEGSKLNEKLISVPGSKPITQVYKLNDTSIHLLGEDTYQIINAKLQKIYP